SLGSQFLQEGIAPRCHLAKIRYGIEWAPAFTKPTKDGLLDFARDYLRVLAVAVEDTGFGFGHGASDVYACPDTTLRKAFLRLVRDGNCPSDFVRFEAECRW